MTNFRVKIAGCMAACLLAVTTAIHPAPLAAQTTGATIHGHVNNPAGQPITDGEVRLTTDRTPGSTTRKFDYTFKLDASGNFQGTDIKPADYVAVVYQGTKSLDFIDSLKLANGDSPTVNFDMTRKDYLDKMTPADRAALEDFKKKNAEVVNANSKIANLNALLASARADNKAGNYDASIKSMTDATTAKPDEPILWVTLGDAQLGQADAASKAARAAHATDASLPDKYTAAAASYQKALDLNAALAKPNVETAATANNQLGQALGKIGKTKEASAAYEAAAKADPPKAGMYFFNEAATLFNAGDGDNAAIAADKAIAADPAKADAYYIKGQALIAKAAVDKNNKITVPPRVRGSLPEVP